MSRRFRFVVLLVSLLGACGGPDVRTREESVAEAVAALVSMEHVLDDDASGPGWLTSGLEPLRKGRQAIAEESPTVSARKAGRQPGHIAKVHIWRIFLWTLGALIVVHLILEHLDVAALVRRSGVTVLFVACLVGLIPESGPHLVFVTLYAQGALPVPYRHNCQQAEQGCVRGPRPP